MLDEPWEGRDQWVLVILPSALTQYTEGAQCVLIANGRQVWWWDTLLQESRDQWVLVLSAQ